MVIIIIFLHVKMFYQKFSYLFEAVIILHSSIIIEIVREIRASGMT